MVKIDVIAGFLGAGKTTLIKKMISDGAYEGEKVALIENEYGDVGIDSGFLKDTGVRIQELTSGCICCSLAGDLRESLLMIICYYYPDRIIIEPSGVAGLSDLAAAILTLEDKDVSLGCLTTVVDATRAETYLKEFDQFYHDQIEKAGTIILSHTTGLSPSELKDRLEMLRQINPNANIVTTDWDMLSGKQLLESIEQQGWLEEALQHFEEEAQLHLDHEHGHEHDHEHGHEHDHEHGHEHGGHHVHADEVFDQVGLETVQEYTSEQIQSMLQKLQDRDTYGYILRAKGMVPGKDGSWIFFDYVPGSIDVRTGTPQPSGMICFIGTGLNKDHLRNLFE